MKETRKKPGRWLQTVLLFPSCYTSRVTLMCQEQTHPSEPCHPPTCSAIKCEFCTLCPFLNPTPQAHVLTLCPGTTSAWGANHCPSLTVLPGRSCIHANHSSGLLPGLCCSISHPIVSPKPMVTIPRTTHLLLPTGTGGTSSTPNSSTSAVLQWQSTSLQKGAMSACTSLGKNLWKSQAQA